MAPVIYLDTHVVAWLFAGVIELIPARIRQRLDAEDLVISPMVSLELQYLHETKRTARPASVVLGALSGAIGLRVCDLPFPRVIETALGQAWTRDPFDRIIVSQAALRQASLVTKDHVIHKHYARAIWEG
jgi:PIN domain nuclease of toxin-antitoxin system